MRRLGQGFAAGLAVAALGAAGCGTAVYEHEIRVVPAGAPILVGVFDPHQGDTRDWAHAAVGVAARETPYRASVTTTPTVTIGSAKDARPMTFALAVPDLTDAGYFVLTIDAPLTDALLTPGFRVYEPPLPPELPTVVVRADADVEAGEWTVRLTVEAPPAAPR
jgi:hypothetical protein